MSVNYHQVVSIRSNDGDVQVVATLTFSGAGVSHESVARAFSDEFKAQTQTLGDDAAASIDKEQADLETGLRAAMSSAIDHIEPGQRQQVLDHFGLATTPS